MAEICRWRRTEQLREPHFRSRHDPV